MRRLAVIFLIAGLAAGISSAHISSSSASPQVPPRHMNPASSGHDMFSLLLSRSRDLGPVMSGTRVSILLELRDSSRRLSGDINAIYSPKSPRFGHFESAGNLRKYGPSASQVRHLQQILGQAGLRATWVTGESWLTVQGTADRMSREFRVHPHAYRAPDGRRFIASRQDPVVPLRLKPLVTGTSHLNSYTDVHPRDIPGVGMTPSELLKAYDITPLRNAKLEGSGETVVFFEIDGFRQSDLDAYTKKYGLPPMHPTIKAGPKLSPGGEAPMDLEAVHAIAPGAKLLVYNLDQNKLANQAQTNTQFVNALVSFQQKIVTENAKAVVSNSVGSCAGVMGKSEANVLKGIYDRADALGEAWFAASGDQGAYDCYQALQQPGSPPSNRDIGVDLPASAPGVTGVGGTRLGVRTDGNWYSEEAWMGPAELSGGGGGVSGYFPRPSWQQAPGVGNRAFDAHRMREVPDVSAIADPGTSGMYAIDGQYTPEGGTSQAAPIWAGIMALIDQYLTKTGGHRLGFANPALYTLARIHQTYAPFHDVTLGNNLHYPATSGYDMASGLGTPDAWNLARDLLTYEHGGR